MAKILTENDVRLCYLGVYGRACNSTEMDYWMNVSSVQNSTQLFQSFRQVEADKPSPGVIPEEEYFTANSTTAMRQRNRAFIELLYHNFFNKITLYGVDDDRSDTSLDGTTMTTSAGHIYKYDVEGGMYWANNLDTGAIGYDVMLAALAYSAFADDIENEDDDLLYNRAALTAKDDFIAISIGTEVVTVRQEIDANGNIIINNGTARIGSSSTVIISTIVNSASQETALKNYLPDPVDYTAEYNDAYEKVLAQTMAASGTPLAELFALIDAEVDVTPRETLSMKKNAYMQILSQVTASAQQTAMNLVDKKHKFSYELQTAKANAIKTGYEADFTESKRKVLLEQVVDNRRIKAMDSLGDTYSTGMAGGLVPTASMWNEYFRLAKELTRNSLEIPDLVYYKGAWTPEANTVDYLAGTAPTTATIEPSGGNVAEKVIGNYWIVDLSKWDVATPVPTIYEAAVGTAGDAYDMDGVSYTQTIDGEPVLTDLIGKTKPVTKVNIPGMKCAISLDGINAWYHGDIVYVMGVEAGDGVLIHTYRRVAGFSDATDVKIAQGKAVASSVSDTAVV